MALNILKQPRGLRKFNSHNDSESYNGLQNLENSYNGLDNLTVNIETQKYRNSHNGLEWNGAPNVQRNPM